MVGNKKVRAKVGLKLGKTRHYVSAGSRKSIALKRTKKGGYVLYVDSQVGESQRDGLVAVVLGYLKQHEDRPRLKIVVVDTEGVPGRLKRGVPHGAADPKPGKPETKTPKRTDPDPSELPPGRLDFRRQSIGGLDS